MRRATRLTEMFKSTSRRRSTTVVVCLLCAMIGLLAAGPDSAGLAATGPAPASVQVRLSGAGVPIPSAFFGLSMEYTGVATYESLGPLFDRVVAMVRPRDESRMLIRIGGKSADHAYWDTPTTGSPRSVFELDGDWMSALASMVARDRLRVMLDLNLGVHSPAMAVSFARAANQTLPPYTLAGVEIGNEPDLYHLQGDLDRERIASTPKSLSPDWESGYSPANYRRDWTSYASALRAALPRLALGGPETIADKPQWLAAIEGLGSLDPQFLTIHRYASSNCWPITSRFYPTIGLMLGESSSAGLARTVRGAVLYAHSLGQQLRLTEVNSISCGGNTGVADSYATALWAPDTLFDMISEGVDGVDWHIRTNAVNAPFIPAPGDDAIIPRPELYGLAMFAQMTGPKARLIATRISSTPSVNVSAWAVQSGTGSKVLLINKGARAAKVKLALGTDASKATVKRLQAPTITSSTGVTFAGQTIGPNAEWQGKQVVSTVVGHQGSFGISLPGYSAALVSF